MINNNFTRVKDGQSHPCTIPWEADEVTQTLAGISVGLDDGMMYNKTQEHAICSWEFCYEHWNHHGHTWEIPPESVQ